MLSPTEAALKVAQQLRAAGFVALFAGGAVRDQLLGREPKDVDVATDATPDQVERVFSRTVAVGAQFGVIVVIVEPGVEVEVATFRADGPYSDARRPDSVVFTSPEEDAKRRDFTLNGLFLDPESGEILDYVGGRADLEARIIRAIGRPADRFKEDRLRMLRAVRFAARYQFRIEPETFAQIQTEASLVTSVSAERIHGELRRMLLEGSPAVAFELLDASRLLAAVLPEIEATKELHAPAELGYVGSTWEHTLMMLEQLDEPSEALAWATLLLNTGLGGAQHDAANDWYELSATTAEAVLLRLRSSRVLLTSVPATIRLQASFDDILQSSESARRRLFRLASFRDALSLHRLAGLASRRSLETWHACTSRLTELKPDELSPQTLVTGKDLQKLGYQRGPLYSQILAVIEDAQLDESVTTREAALSLLKERFPLEPTES